jgi:hypothetical protein
MNSSLTPLKPNRITRTQAARLAHLRNKQERGTQMSLEEEYTNAAFVAVQPWLYLLPTDVQRKIKLANEAHRTHSIATCEELRKEFGSNWVIARRTPRIVEKYGPDVKTITFQQYEDATRRAIESRVA